MRRRHLAAALAAIALAPADARADAYWIEVIRDAARRHGVDGDWLVWVCQCESEYTPDAVGQPNPDGSGHDTGLFQFSPATWAEMTGYMGISASIWDGHAQAEVAAWAFGNGFACRWVCACPDHYQ